MIRRPPRSTRTYPLFPYTTLFPSLRRSVGRLLLHGQCLDALSPEDHQHCQSPAATCTRGLRRDRHLCRVLLLHQRQRSEEHTSELQSLMRISYAVFCLNNNKHQTQSLISTHTLQSLAKNYSE